MKRFLSIFLIFNLIFNFSFTSFSYADTISELPNVQIKDFTFDSGSGDIEDMKTITEETPSSAPKAGWLQKILDSIIGLLTWVYTPVIITIYTLPTIDGCIFGAQDYFQLTFFESTQKGIAGSIQGYVGAAYNAFRYLVTAVYVVVLVYIGIRMILSSVGRQKAQYKEMFKHWLIGLLLIFSFHWVMAGIIWLSNTFVDILQGISMELLDLRASGLNIIGFLNSIDLLDGVGLTNIAPEEHPITTFICYNISKGSIKIPTIGVVLGLILFLVLLGASLAILFTYLKRLFTISLLILLFPFVALSYVFDKMGDRKAQTLSFWLKEFIVNVMIQPIHALLLVMISLIFATAMGPGNTNALFGANIAGAIFSVGILFLIPMGEKLLKQLFQISSSMGTGRDGIGGTLARAGMAYRGMKDMGSAAAKMGKGIMANHNIKKGLGYSRSYEGRKAYQNALAQGKTKEEARNARLQAQTDAATRFRDDKNNKSGNYKEYLKALKKETGMKSEAGANAKAVAQIAGIALGSGAALTSSEDLSKLAANVATNATMIGTLAGGAAELPNKIKDARDGVDGDYTDRLNKLNKIADLDAKDPATTKLRNKIAAELDIDVSMVNNKNKDDLISSYTALDRYTRFGGQDKDFMKTLTTNGMAIKNIDKGLMPDGSGPLDKSKFTVTQDNKNMFMEDADGNKYFFKGRGNPKLRYDEQLVANLADLENAPSEEAKMQYVQSNKNVKNAEADLKEDREIQKQAQEKLEKANNVQASAKAQSEFAAGRVTGAETIRDIRQEEYFNATETLSNINEQLAYDPSNPDLKAQRSQAQARVYETRELYEESKMDYQRELRNQENADKDYEYAQREYAKAQTEATKANRDVQRSERKLETAIDSASENYSAVFNAAGDAANGLYTSPETISTTFSPTPTLGPEPKPFRLFAVTNGKDAEVKNYLASLGNRDIFVQMTSDGKGLEIEGRIFEDCGFASTSQVGGSSAIVIFREGQWFIKD